MPYKVLQSNFNCIESATKYQTAYSKGIMKIDTENSFTGIGKWQLKLPRLGPAQQFNQLWC